MPVPGYDPDDVEQLIETTIDAKFDREELSDRLSEEQLTRVESGERVVDVVDDETIDKLLEERVFEGAGQS